MKKYIFAFITLMFMTTLISAQDRVKVDDNQSYLILSTKRLTTLELELNEVAAKGYRVLFGAPTNAYDIAVLLKRLDDTKSAPYVYKVLATSLIKTMEKELNENGANGYRVLPRTIAFKPGLLVAELVTLMERAPKADVKYEYRLVGASRETQLHELIDTAIAEGYTPTTMIRLGKTVVVMEKELSAK